MTILTVVQGDITKIKVDAIVNAANSTLLGGGGVDGAIHKAAGSALFEACKKLNGCKTGNAKLTPGFNLNAQYIIHAVGPVWKNGLHDEPQQLVSCYKQCLEIAISKAIKTIAFPNISTGIYRFPKRKAALLAIEAVRDFLNENEGIDEVIFCTFDDENFELYNRLLNH